MYKQLHTQIEGNLTADISSVATFIPIDSATAAILQTEINFAGGEWTYLELSNGSYTEEIRVTEVNNGMITVDRHTSDSTPQVFGAADTFITASRGSKAVVQDLIAQSPQSINFTLSGTGAALVSGISTARNVHVDEAVLLGQNGVEVMGAWPNFTIGLSRAAGGCCPGEGTGGVGTIGSDGTAVTSLQLNSTILQGSVAANILTLSLATPTFTGLSGIVVGGIYPNYTIDASGVGNGTATTVGVGTGLTLTGSPTVNPVISLSNTGVIPGNYDGFIIDAQGRITNVPVSFSFISSVAINHGIVSVISGVANITLDDADVAQKGMIAISDPSAALDPLDDLTAVTPALLATQLTGYKATVVGSMSGEADVLYTTTVGAAIAVNLLAGEKALVVGEIVVLDGTTPLTPVAYGVSVFASAGGAPVRIYGSKIMTQSKQTMLGTITGPFVGTMSVVTTDLPAGAVVQGSSLMITKAA